MTTLLDLKQTIQTYYIKYEFYISLGWKFLLALVSLMTINSKLGYQGVLMSPLIVLMCSLLCAILPATFLVVMDALFVLAHLWALSREAAIVGFLIFILMFLLYYRFAPADAPAVIVTPLCFAMGFPYVMPLGLGLLGTPASVVTVVFGTVIHYYLKFISDNVATFREAAADEAAADTIARLQSVIDGAFGNNTMIAIAAVFAVTLVIVYVIRRLPVDHCHDIAIGVGSITLMIGMLIASASYNADVSAPGVIIGTILAALLLKGLEFFTFNLDYSRVENVQFEDDDYYYYVKAVPKVSVPTPERRVKQINRANLTSSEDSSSPVDGNTRRVVYERRVRPSSDNFAAGKKRRRTDLEKSLGSDGTSREADKSVAAPQRRRQAPTQRARNPYAAPSKARNAATRPGTQRTPQGRTTARASSGVRTAEAPRRAQTANRPGTNLGTGSTDEKI